ncbi:hypothetical protein VTG60DRAFT_1127 [Thermothelomyces hinnuleus]
MVGNCNRFHLVVSGDGCTSIGYLYGVTLAQLVAWNPAIGSPTTLTTTTRTTPTNGITTPTPTQSGMVSNCNLQRRIDASDDTCELIASRYRISLATFYSWNRGVGDKCQSLWLDTYYCVGRL